MLPGVIGPSTSSRYEPPAGEAELEIAACCNYSIVLTKYQYSAWKLRKTGILSLTFEEELVRIELTK
jgi:hypothetical protein